MDVRARTGDVVGLIEHRTVENELRRDNAVPAHLRGAGFGAFNLVSILFGAAAAPIIVGALADVWNLRVAFLIVSPPVYVGAWILFLARNHLDADALKIFEAVVRAMQNEQERTDATRISDPSSAEEAT